MKYPDNRKVELSPFSSQVGLAFYMDEEGWLHVEATTYRGTRVGYAIAVPQSQDTLPITSECAEQIAEYEREAGRSLDVYYVGATKVEEAWRRRGLATALYSHLARAAGERDAVLIANACRGSHRTSPAAKGVWASEKFGRSTRRVGMVAWQRKENSRRANSSGWRRVR